MLSEMAKRLFPQLTGEWVQVNFNEVAASFMKIIEPITTENVLLNPIVSHRLSEFVRELHDADYTWGGFLEDRSILWRDHYMKPGEMTHLGVDFGVPQDTAVYLPVAGILRHSFQDPDQNGGWGGKLIFECETNYGDKYFLILGHLKSIVNKIGTRFEKGTPVGLIAETECNGGWSPHLHVQCMRDFVPDVDGYGPHYNGIEEDFYDPYILILERRMSREMLLKIIPKEIPSWEFFDVSEKIEFKCLNYMNRQGFNLVTSQKGPFNHISKEPGILVSIGIIRSFRPDLTDQQHWELRDKEIPGFLKAFFGKIEFQSLPDHPSMPSMKHFFATMYWDQN